MKAARTILLFSTLVIGCNTGSGSNKGLFQLETEPNDKPCCPNVVGKLGPGGKLGVFGSITDDGSDPFDGFSITSTTAFLLEFFLESDSGNLDLAIFDPDTEEFVAEFTMEGTVEAGFLEVLAPNKELFLVVCSVSGTTDYELDMFGSPLPMPASGDGPAFDVAGVADPGPFLAYLGEDEAGPEEVEVLPIGTWMLLDTESGETWSRSLGRTGDGHWVTGATPGAEAP